MRPLRIVLFVSVVAFAVSSCGVFKAKRGCPSDGRNVGAERLLSEPPKKVKKFKA